VVSDTFHPAAAPSQASRRRYTVFVQVFTARVKGGVIVPDEGVELPEGSRVTVIADAREAPFELTAAEEAELAEAIAEVERGEVISAAELLRRLSR
jgi:predicted DNA-binding antitoxin AbrB/MazE fold protein